MMESHPVVDCLANNLCKMESRRVNSSPLLLKSIELPSSSFYRRFRFYKDKNYSTAFFPHL